MIKAGFSAHPSHPGAMEGFGESEAEIYQSIQDNGSVQYLGNTPDMGSSTRPGGLADSILDPVITHGVNPRTRFDDYFTWIFFQVYIREFESPCDHGFYNRGDLEDPQVLECVESAYAEMLELFDTYV